MFSSTFQTLLTALLLIPLVQVNAHGQLRSVSINGQNYDAPNLYYDGDARNANTPIRKGYKADSPSYLLPPDFSNDNKMACQEASAAPGLASAHPGDTITFKWEGATHELDGAFGAGSWVHGQGPIITYIGSCNGDCHSVDASQIGWQKIDFQGLWGGDILQTLRDALAAKPEPYRSTGVWGLANLIENQSQYSVQVPQGLKNGQYIIRSELSAVHNPLNGDPTSGPQNYVGCLQIDVTNGGDVELPYGTKAGSLYPTNGDLATYSVFNSPASFPEVGPAKWNGASGSSSNPSPPAQSQGSDNSNNNQGQQSGDNSNQNQGQNTDNSNQNQGGDNSNQNQGGDNSNQGQGQNLQSGSDSGSGSDNSNNGGDNSNQGQQNTDTGSNQGSSNSTGHCRRRTHKKRDVAIKGRHVAKRHAGKRLH
ncbi:hypothetical protein V5O48_011592 [Marasmius crinis-equi]|uniref:lytic cellulose monooxygenase (C4-dehydrogenating) n=1 Tax=Marasmius crinis-equi TaxID=585013 RepID=A0ABR3F535_9AGAR